MKRKIGTIMMILGTTLILGALYLFLSNQQEAAKAEAASEQLMVQLEQQIADHPKQGMDATLEIPVELLEAEDLEMPEVVINGNSYVGYLTIPKLGLRLPVMTAWSYPRLRIAPCRYTGTMKGEDLVILAHNYAAHFGGLKNLNPGDSVTYTDMDGTTYTYEVALLDVLNPTAVEEVTESGYALTLFTCTYGGASRVTVYCDRK